MHDKKLIKFLMITICFELINCDIDPFAMEVNNFKLDEQLDCPPMNHMAVSYYKRSLNMVLNLMRANEEQSMYNGEIYLTISADDFYFLQAFAKGNDETVDLFHRVDDILSKLYQKTITTSMLEQIRHWLDNIYFNLFNRRTLIFVIFFVAIFMCYKLLKSRLTLLRIFKHLIFLAWIIDFVFVWVHLLQNAEINKIHATFKYKNVPVECDPNKMSYWQSFMHAISTTDECKQYYHVLMKDEFWSISPLLVLSEQFRVIIKTPIISIGSALAEMVSTISAILPWYCNLIFMPIILVCFTFFSCILLSFATQTPFGFNFFHLINIHFGEKNQGKKILKEEHRPMIEEIHMPHRQCHKKKALKQVDTDSEDAESEDSAINEEINVCKLRKKSSKRKDRIVIYTNKLLIDDKKQISSKDDEVSQLTNVADKVD